MLVSVIIPTFNRYDIVQNAINSVLNQDYISVECLVIDDHSTDQSCSKLKAKYSNDQRVRILENVYSKGAQGARNTGILFSNSNFLCFLDSDDILTDFSISNRMSYFSNDIVLVYGDFISQCFPKNITYSKNYIRRNLSLCPFSSMMVNKQKILEVYPGFKLDETFEAWQDDDFIFDLASVGEFKHCKSIVAQFAPINREFSISQSKLKFVNNFKRMIDKRKSEIIIVSRFHYFICKSLFIYFYIRYYPYKFSWINRLLRFVISPFELFYKLYFNRNFI
jgi:glycosyltransferase involved in cell wall biosynthesis